MRSFSPRQKCMQRERELKYLNRCAGIDCSDEGNDWQNGSRGHTGLVTRSSKKEEEEDNDGEKEENHRLALDWLGARGKKKVPRPIPHVWKHARSQTRRTMEL